MCMRVCVVRGRRVLVHVLEGCSKVIIDHRVLFDELKYILLIICSSLEPARQGSSRLQSVSFRRGGGGGVRILQQQPIEAGAE